MASIAAQQLALTTGIPADYIDALEQMGFPIIPFHAGTINQGFQDVESAQRALKGSLDTLLQSFGSDIGTNVGMLPANVRNYFAGAEPVFKDPRFGIGGGMFSGGSFKFGDLPLQHSTFFNQLIQAQNAPKFVPPPNVGGGGGGNALTGSFKVPLAGGGDITVNANSEAAALQNAQSATGGRAANTGIIRVG